MSLNEDYEKRKERKEKNKVRREKLAGYFFNLSQLSFAALVLGGITPLFNNTMHTANLITVPFGAFVTYGLAKFGNNILKY